MKLVKVAAATLNQTPLDWENNQANILGAIAEARSRRVSVLCLPELCVTGYGCEDAFLSASLHSTALQILEEILPHTEGIAVSLGLPVAYNNVVFNTACLVADGRIAGGRLTCISMTSSTRRWSTSALPSFAIRFNGEWQAS